MQLQRATRKRVKMKLLLSSPTGFGKTYSALLMAYGITGDWTKIAVIDTENRSASLYSHLGEWQTVEMTPPYAIEDFEKAIKLCVDGGIEVIIADSVTHYWNEVKAYVDRLGSGFTNWKKGTPLWEKLVNLILQTDTHFICTARKKQAYEIIKDDKGKSQVEKKGLEDQIRDGFDYEMTVAFELINDNHLAKSAKDRTEMFTGKPEFVITVETGKKIKEWCELGIDTKKELTETQLTTVLARIKNGEAGVKEKVKASFTLTEDQIKQIDAA